MTLTVVKSQVATVSAGERPDSESVPPGSLGPGARARPAGLARAPQPVLEATRRLGDAGSESLPVGQWLLPGRGQALATGTDSEPRRRSRSPPVALTVAAGTVQAATVTHAIVTVMPDGA